ncbi:MAG: HisA/HisF-related TIM barrel protein [Thermoplasmata archaeon]
MPSEPRPAGPALVPCVLLRGGAVCRPGPDGPVTVRTASGTTVDPFDIVDRLAPEYSMLYVVDLDGIERGDPQLDYLQELARDMTLWVDAGVRTADQAIDVLITGARRAVLSSAYLRGPRQLARAWRLSTELVFEIEVVGAALAPADTRWGTTDATELARVVRAAGPDHLIVSPRETEPDWALVRAIAAGGPTWVDGTFSPAEAPRLAESGASGGIFHIESLLDSWEA